MALYFDQNFPLLNHNFGQNIMALHFDQNNDLIEENNFDQNIMPYNLHDQDRLASIKNDQYKLTLQGVD